MRKHNNPQAVLHIESSMEQDWVDRARSGDTEAFGMLISHYRANVYGWARSYTSNWSVAEEISQDAWVKALLHVDQLTEAVRFSAWLRQIVRHQAYMKLRRGGPYAKETPLSSLVATNDTQERTEAFIDSIPCKMPGQYEPEPPEQVVLRQELAAILQKWMTCLNDRERGMMQAYYVDELQPKEIAAMFNTTAGSVYSHLHRSKAKIRKFMAEAEKPESVSGQRVQSVAMLSGRLNSPYSWLDRLVRMMRSRGCHMDITESMGRSGLAFRLKISDKTTFADGVFVFDWQQQIKDLLHTAGYDAVFHTGVYPGSPVPLLAVSEAFSLLHDPSAVIDFVRESITYGSPVLFFDTYVKPPFVHEWNIIYAYNDYDRIVKLTDVLPPYESSLTYEQLAASPLLFLCSARQQNKLPEPVSVSALLASIIHDARHGDGYKHYTPYLSYTSGLEAYNTWIEHLKKGWGHLNDYGHRYMVYTYTHARSFAGPYLQSLTVPGFIEPAIRRAAELYDEIASLFMEMSLLCPFLEDTNPEQKTDPLLNTCIILLTQAQHCEVQAIEQLESALEQLNKQLFE